MLARCLDVVLHDEEVAREAHALDRRQLEVDALPHLLRQSLLAILAPSPLIGQVTQIVVIVFIALGDGEVGH